MVMETETSPERDILKQHLHIQDRIDGHTCLAHITDDAGVVGIVAAVGGQIEGH